jgi:hypothetical protein
MGGVSELPQSGANRFNTMNGEPIDLSYEFGPFRLEPATRRSRAGESLPLTPRRSTPCSCSCRTTSAS